MKTFDELLAVIDDVQDAPGGWTAGQMLTHCAQSVEFSMTGFPKPAAFLVRALIGPLVMSRFLKKGAMSHDLTAEIPGAPSLGNPTKDEGVARLKKAIADFRAFSGTPAPHFAYGAVTKAQYEALHVMHFANHREGK